MEYACHYCGRTNGMRTRDHKIPKAFGGSAMGTMNIVHCCRMCNAIKSARHYGMFVAFFSEFLELHRVEYRARDPDDMSNIRLMTSRFDKWLLAKQEICKTRAARGRTCPRQRARPRSHTDCPSR